MTNMFRVPRNPYVASTKFKPTPALYRGGDDYILYSTDQGYARDGNRYWVSGPLNNRQDPGTKYTLKQFFLEYESMLEYELDSGREIVLNFSGDGGVTYGKGYRIKVVDTSGGIVMSSVAPNITGWDIRVKISLPPVRNLRITAFEPVLVQRGNP